MNRKECNTCFETKSIELFHKNPSTKDGINTKCKDCVKEYRRAYYLKNKHKELSNNKTWKTNNPDYMSNYFASDKGKESRRESRERAKKRVIEHFGGECAECGSDQKLELDHKNGDGKEHRKKVFGSQKGCDMYKYLVANNMNTDGYILQLLCYDCHRHKTNIEMKALRGRG